MVPEAEIDVQIRTKLSGLVAESQNIVENLCRIVAMFQCLQGKIDLPHGRVQNFRVAGDERSVGGNVDPQIRLA